MKFIQIRFESISVFHSWLRYLSFRLVGTEGGQKSQEIRETTAKPKSQTLPEIGMSINKLIQLTNNINKVVVIIRYCLY